MTAPVVGVDVRRAGWAPHLGISRYARGLIAGIVEARPPDLEVIVMDLLGSDRWPSVRRWSVGRGTSWPQRLLQEQLVMPAAGRRMSAMHLPWSEGPIFCPCPLVVTVHDLDTAINPSSYRRRFRLYYNALLRAHIRRADRIIVPSQVTQDAIAVRWPTARTVLIPHGLDRVFGPGDDVSASGGRRQVLYTGGFAPRKRLGDLLEAFESVVSRRDDAELVLTGHPPDEARAWVAERHIEHRVRFTGYLSDEELAACYRAAAVVAYPSELEGFGFPVVEAFASGAPVVACAAGSIPEVAGGAALLVPPRRPRELADALLSVLEDSLLAATLRSAGLERAQRWSWPTVARQTLDVYRELIL